MTITTNGSTNGGNVMAVANGSITLGAVTTNGASGTSGSVILLGNGITDTKSIDTSNAVAANAGTVNIFSGTVQVNPTVLVQFGSILTGSFSGNAAQGNISLGGLSSGAVTIKTGATGSVISSAAITSSAIIITAGTGGVGTAGAPLQTTAASLTVASTGDVNINNTGALTLFGSTGNNFTLAASGAVSTNGNTTAGAVLTINTNNLNVAGADTLTGTSVDVNGPAGSDLTVNNAGNITATTGSINIISTPGAGVGGNLFIAGGGTMTAASGAVNLTAATSGNVANTVDFAGNQTFSGTANITASGAMQSIVINTGVTVTGMNAVFLDSPMITKNGTITGNPLVANPGVTIADSTGMPLDISTLGSLLFTQDLAILSAGNITDSNNPVTINLTNGSGAGNSLTLIAGFNFTPGSGGGVQGPDHVDRTITGAGTGIIDLADTTITTTGTTTGGNVTAIANGSITLGSITTTGGSGVSGNVSLLGNGVTVNGIINTANATAANAGSINITSATVTINSPVHVLNGDISAGSFTANVAQGTIALAGVNAGGPTITLTTGGAGAITSSGTIVGSALLLTGGTGGIGAALSPLPTGVQSLTFNSVAGVTVANLGPLTLNASTGAAITILDNAAVTTLGGTTATATLALDVPTLNVSFGDTLKGASVIINGLGGFDLAVNNAGTITGGSIAVSGAIGNNATINNSGNITATATTLNITSTPSGGAGGNLTILGGGIMTANSGSVNLTAVNGGALANKIDFTGSQTFNGLTTLNAVGANQSVAVEAGAHVVGNNEMDVNSLLLSLNGGTITANPLVIRPAGTIANSKGPLDLSTFGILLYSGQSLAILSAGNIIDNNQPVTINTSNPSGVGGPVTLIAGYNFTPVTVGTVGPSNATYTITKAGVGSIMLGDTTILTNGSSNGGNLVAIATGAITLGAVNTSGGTGTSGSVTLIGNGITANGTIITSNPTPANAGAITAYSGSATIVGSVSVHNGAITSGSFAPNASLSGVTLAGISAGTAPVTLTAGGTGAITSSATITAGTLTMTSGSVGIGSATANIITSAGIITATAGSANVFITDTGATTLVGANSGGQFNLTAGGAVNVNAGAIPVTSTLNINATGVITFASNNVSVSTQATGAGGSLTLTGTGLSWATVGTQPLNLSAQGTAANDGGAITVNVGSALNVGSAAGDVSFAAQGGSTSGNGGAVTISSGGVLTIDSTALKVNPQSGVGNGGALTLTGTNITNAGAGALALDVSGQGTGTGGSVSVTATSSPLVIGNANGQILLTANSGATSGDAGKVTVDSINSSVTINAAGLNVAPQGTTGNGGSIDIIAKQIINGGALALTIDASGKGMGSGGSVRVESDGAGTINIGVGPGDITLSATSGTSGGNGGSATAVVNGALNVDVAGLSVAPLFGNGNGGNISLQGTSITWPTVASAPLMLNANGLNGGNGGVVSVTIVLSGQITLGSNKGDVDISAQSGANGGNGGSASVTTQGNITIDTGIPLIGPLGLNGNGGSIALNASGLTFVPGSTLILNGDGKGTGNGGTVAVNLSGSQNVTIGTAVGDVELLATGGAKSSANGNGGSAILKTGGNLAVNPLGLNVNPLGKLGNGGSLDLEAGVGAGTNNFDLLVSGALSVNGIGKTGLGGNITLASNDSSTAFNVGSTAKGLVNGTTKTLSVKGTTTNGTIVLENLDGDVTNTSALTVVNSLQMISGGNGNVIIGGTLGSTKTANITLSATGKGNVLSNKTSSTAIATSVTLSSTTGNVGGATAAIVNTSNLTATALGGLVNVSNKSTKVLNLYGQAGSLFTLSSSAKVVAETPIVAGNVLTITGTGSSSISSLTPADALQAPSLVITGGSGGLGTTTQALSVNGGTLTAKSTGAINVKSVGAGVIQLAGSNTGKSFTFSSNGDISVTGVIATTAAAVNIVAGGTGNILQGTSGLINGKTVSLGAVTGSIGVSGTPLEVTSASVAALTGGNVVVDDKSKSTATIRNSSAADLVFTTAAATNIDNLTASNGSISVTNATGLLQTVKGAVLHEASSTSGNITLQENNVKSGTIVIGTNTNISTLSTTGGGDVTITIGVAQPFGGVAPTKFLAVNTVSGQANYGTHSITTVTPTNTLNLEGANITFSTAGLTLRTTSIKLNGGVIITADPLTPFPTIASPQAGYFVQQSAVGGIVAPTVSSALPAGGIGTLVSSNSFIVSGTEAPTLSSAMFANSFVSPVVSSAMFANGTGAPTISSAMLSNGLVTPAISSSQVSNGILPTAGSPLATISTQPLQGGVSFQRNPPDHGLEIRH